MFTINLSLFLKQRLLMFSLILNITICIQAQIPKTNQVITSGCNVLSPELFRLNTPYGSGDRTLTICINKCGYRPNEIEVVVFYSKTESQLSSVTIDPTAAYGHGKAKYNVEVGNIFRYEYTFPHSGFKDINGSPASEYKIIEMKSRDANKDPQKVFYRIGVKLASSSAFFQTSATASFHMPDPITIAMVGDSYASGQGAPIQDNNLFTDPSQLWSDGDPETNTDIPCHRSYLSGQAQAAERVRRDSKKLGIAIKHVSCQGATVSELAQQKQNTGGMEVALQFELIKNWLDSKGYEKLDILLMGIGGNDVGFAQVIVDFMINPFGNFHTDSDAKNRYSDPTHGEYPFNDLKAAYTELNNDILAGDFFTISTIGTPVIIHGYPSPCKGPIGSPWCGQAEDWFLGANNKVGNCWGTIEQDDKPDEFKDMHNIIVGNLNKAIEEAAQDNEWNYVDVAGRAGNHGLSNCSQPYFNTLGQSFARQGDADGMIHPNSNGYQNIYVEPLMSAIKKQILKIRIFWKKFDPDCSADEKARAEASRQLLVEIVKSKQLAKAQKKHYPVIKPYSVYRNKFSKQVEDVTSDYKNQIKQGKIKPIQFPALSPEIIKNIDFTDRFKE